MTNTRSPVLSRAGTASPQPPPLAATITIDRLSQASHLRSGAENTRDIMHTSKEVDDIVYLPYSHRHRSRQIGKLNRQLGSQRARYAQCLGKGGNEATPLQQCPMVYVQQRIGQTDDCHETYSCTGCHVAATSTHGWRATLHARVEPEGDGWYCLLASGHARHLDHGRRKQALREHGRHLDHGRRKHYASTGSPQARRRPREGEQSVTSVSSRLRTYR